MLCAQPKTILSINLISAKIRAGPSEGQGYRQQCLYITSSSRETHVKIRFLGFTMPNSLLVCHWTSNISARQFCIFKPICESWPATADPKLMQPLHWVTTAVAFSSKSAGVSKNWLKIYCQLNITSSGYCLEWAIGGNIALQGAI